MRRLDLGPDAERGIGRFPAVTGEPYATFVAAVDSDGNEVAGVRLPDIAVPVATSTGWNTRHATAAGPEQLIPMAGSTLPFASSLAERERDADPRPSIAERYRDRNDYLARVRAVAQELARCRSVGKKQPTPHNLPASTRRSLPPQLFQLPLGPIHAQLL
ncbi:MAG: hypothetical protein J2P17_06440 [Mycobacterium sp.]|nr:hypothetical protein [Mycobacterium sp.]